MSTYWTACLRGDSLNVVFYSTRSFKDEMISSDEIENIEPNITILRYNIMIAVLFCAGQFGGRAGRAAERDSGPEEEADQRISNGGK